MATNIIKHFSNTGRCLNHFGGLKLFPHVECVNGENFSIQASAYHYCTPQETLEADKYTSFEVYYSGQNKEALEMLDMFRVNANTYGCVPVEVINDIIDACGGIDLGDDTYE